MVGAPLIRLSLQSRVARARMRNILRFVFPLMVVLGGLAFAASQLAEHLAMRWALRDLEMRDRLIATTLAGSLTPMLTASADP